MTSFAGTIVEYTVINISPRLSLWDQNGPKDYAGEEAFILGASPISSKLACLVPTA